MIFFTPCLQMCIRDRGKTDVVSGVSISIGGFVDLARQCLEQAAGIEPETQAPADDAAVAETEGTSGASQIDAISGATISSTAAVKGINDAYEFLQTVK